MNRLSLLLLTGLVVPAGLVLASAGCTSPDAVSSTGASTAVPADTMQAPAADTLSLDALADTLAPAEAARYAFHGRDLEGKDGPLAKIGEELAHLYFAHRAHRRQSQSGPFQPAGGMSVAEGRVTIDATASESGPQLEADLAALGLAGGAVAGPVVSGRLPVEALPEAAALASLRSMRPSVARMH